MVELDWHVSDEWRLRGDAGRLCRASLAHSESLRTLVDRIRLSRAGGVSEHSGDPAGRQPDPGAVVGCADTRWHLQLPWVSACALQSVRATHAPGSPLAGCLRSGPGARALDLLRLRATLDGHRGGRGAGTEFSARPCDRRAPGDRDIRGAHRGRVGNPGQLAGVADRVYGHR